MSGGVIERNILIIHQRWLIGRITSCSDLMNYLGPYKFNNSVLYMCVNSGALKSFNVLTMSKWKTTLFQCTNASKISLNKQLIDSGEYKKQCLENLIMSSDANNSLGYLSSRGNHNITIHLRSYRFFHGP